MLVPFIKMHGCGNDFVVIDERDEAFGITPAIAAALADRRTGIGCDQLILIEPAPRGSKATAFMRIFNPDGSEAGACGNATRCVAGLIGREARKRKVTIATVSGSLPATLQPDGEVAVDMGAPRLGWQEVPLARAMDTLHLDLALGPVADPAAASMGNPHATFFVPDLEAIDVDALGPALETHPLFPDRANIGFAQVLGPGRIRLAVWERGAGRTRACGSAACAAVVNAHRRGLAERAADVLLDGGTLHIDWREKDGHVLMAGPTTSTFMGAIDISIYAP